MSIMLGNLTVDQIEKRAGVVFPESLKEYMKPRQQASATNIQTGKWHCFDMPFMLVCGGMEVATEIHNSLKDQSANFKQQLSISLSKP